MRRRVKELRACQGPMRAMNRAVPSSTQRYSDRSKGRAATSPKDRHLDPAYSGLKQLTAKHRAGVGRVGIIVRDEL